MAFLIAQPAMAAVPHLLNHQGRIAVGGAPFDGTGFFKFALVDATGTTTYWSNDGTSAGGGEPTAAVTLTVTQGLYAVLLGDTGLTNMTALLPSIFDNSDVRLRVWFDDGVNGSELITPDHRLATAPWAIAADSAALAATVPDGAITTSKIAAGAVGGTQLASGLTLGGTTSGTFSGNGSALTGVDTTPADGSITSAKLAAGAVSSAKIAAGAVGNSQLASGLTLGGTTSGTFSGDGSALTGINTTPADGSITSAKLAAGAVSSAKIAAGAVGGTQLASGLTLGGTTSGTFSGDGSALTGVDTTPADGSITSIKIADDAIVDADVKTDANIMAAKLGTGAVDNTEFDYLDGVTSALQGQIDGKQATIGTGDTIDAGSYHSNSQNALQVNPYGAVAGNTGEVRFNELLANGTESIGLKAADALDANYVLTLPPNDGESLDVLQTDGAGILSWAAVPSAPVTDVNGKTGSVTLAASDIASGEFPSARLADGAVTSAKIADDAVGNSQLASGLTLGGTTSGTFSGDGSALTGITATIPDGSITSAKLAAGAVSSAKIAAGAVGGTQLASGLTLGGTTSGTFSGDGSALTGVDTTPADGSITSIKIADDAIVDADVKTDANIMAAKLGTGAVDNTEFDYLDGVTSALQGQIDGKQATIGTGDTIDAGSYHSNSQNALQVNPYGAVAGNTGEVRFNELLANGTESIGLKAADALDANYVLTLPPNDGENLDVLQTDGAGILSWAAIPSAPVTDVNGKTGSVTLAASDIASGEFPAARLADGAVTSAKIADDAVGNSQLASGLTLGGTTSGTFSGNGSALTGIDTTPADGSITSAKIADDAVVATKIAAGAVGGTQLASGLTLGGTTSGTFSGDGSALTGITATIPDGSITAAKIASDAVTSAKIADGAVGNSDLASNLTLGGTTSGIFVGDGSGLTGIGGGSGTSLLADLMAPPVEPVVAWGDNHDGQSTVPPLANVTAVAASTTQSIGLLDDGTVVAWGTGTAVPGGLSTVTHIAAGTAHFLARKSDGTLEAWGDDTFNQSTVPGGITNATDVAAGEKHSLVLRADGTVTPFGDNTFGQLTVPGAATNVTAIAAGSDHCLALKADGTVVAWGRNDSAQATVPGGLSNVVAIAAGAFHSLAVKGDGTVVAWGWDTGGQSTVPGGLTGVTAVGGGFAFSMALKSDGTLETWGDNTDGQTTVPPEATQVTAIAAGASHVLALRSDLIPAQVARLDQDNVFTGNVGIQRVAANNSLEVEGQASKSTAGNWVSNSDRRIKMEIAPLSNALEILDRVRLVDFRYTDDYRAAHPGIEDKRYLNVIAQEFGEVFPGHVQSSGETLPDGSEILQVDTYPLTIYSAAAVQELHRENEALKKKVADQEERLRRLEKAMGVEK